MHRVTIVNFFVVLFLFVAPLRIDAQEFFTLSQILAPKLYIIPNGDSLVIKLSQKKSITTINNKKISIIIHGGKLQQSVAAIYLNDNDNYIELFKSGPDTSYFSKPIYFKMKSTNSNDVVDFIYIIEYYYYYQNEVEHLFQILPKGELRKISIISASKSYEKYLKDGESIRKPVRNHFNDDTASFEFGIWDERDANCCPHAIVYGKYFLEKRERGNFEYKILLGSFHRKSNKNLN